MTTPSILPRWIREAVIASCHRYGVRRVVASAAIAQWEQGLPPTRCTGVPTPQSVAIPAPCTCTGCTAGRVHALLNLLLREIRRGEGLDT